MPRLPTSLVIGGFRQCTPLPISKSTARSVWSSDFWSRWSGFTATTSALAAAGETHVACEQGETRIMSSTPGAHPHFNDLGAVKWYTSFAEGLADAKVTQKKVFIEYGREA